MNDDAPDASNARENENDPLATLDLALKYSRDVGLYCGQAMGETRPSIQKRLFAAMRGAEKSLASLHPHLVRLLGGTVGSAEAHSTYQALKGRRTCTACGAGGGWRARSLHFWTSEGVPLPFILKSRGAASKAIQQAALTCDLLCPKCARARGYAVSKKSHQPLTRGVEL